MSVLDCGRSAHRPQLSAPTRATASPYRSRQRTILGFAARWAAVTSRHRCEQDRGLAVVELIGATTTKAGLRVESVLDTRSYQKGIKVSNAEMKFLDITGDQFHPEWNYTIKPQPS
jgi:hypothetical protein